MDNLFSRELKQLIAKSRDIAIDLGYDYISTIHFFIADCESKTSSSILNFAFKSEGEFSKYKNDYTLPKDDLLNHFDCSLPLTIEAEITIKLIEKERILDKKKLAYPNHLFLAALRNKKSLLYNSFKNMENVYESLKNYYEKIDEVLKSKMTDEEISQQYYIPKSIGSKKMFNGLFRFFKRKK